MPDTLSSRGAYETFIYTLTDHFPSIRRSTLVYVPTGQSFGRIEGILFFDRNLVLCVQEFLNFELGVIEGYGYEVSHPQVLPDSIDPAIGGKYCRASYSLKTVLYWYDSFPHPNDPSLAPTDPHHKHIPPDIKYHRVVAPDLSFTRPNLPFLIREIEQLLSG